MWEIKNGTNLFQHLTYHVSEKQQIKQKTNTHAHIYVYVAEWNIWSRITQSCLMMEKGPQVMQCHVKKVFIPFC